MNLVRHHYHLDKPVGAYTLRELRGMVEDIPFVNPHCASASDDKPEVRGKPDDSGTLML